MSADLLLIVGIVVVTLLLASAVAGYVATRRRRESVPVGAPLGAPLEGRLAAPRRALASALRATFGRGALDDPTWESLEEALIAADVGVSTSAAVVERVRASHPADIRTAEERLRSELVAALSGRDRSLHLDGDPAIVMVVGVNGTGKTTSIAKLAARLRVEGLEPLLGAADTFRAAADSQLRIWAERVGVDVVSGSTGADPAAVAFDAVAAGRARGRDVVIVDTAGRLHSKQNLMAELAKVKRVLEREAGTVGEVLLVMDATAGQNGIAQVREFTRAVGVTGIVLTKLDGTARGGIVVAIERELDIPVKFIGVGEGMDDLLPFVPADFVEALVADV
jgi:fused signal recognition particle receptor